MQGIFSPPGIGVGSNGQILKRTTAKITATAAQRIPDSPTQMLYPSVDASSAPTTAFHTECAQIQGQILPEERRSQAKTKAICIPGRIVLLSRERISEFYRWVGKSGSTRRVCVISAHPSTIRRRESSRLLHLMAVSPIAVAAEFICVTGRIKEVASSRLRWHRDRSSTTISPLLSPVP